MLNKEELQEALARIVLNLLGEIIEPLCDIQEIVTDAGLACINDYSNGCEEMNKKIFGKISIQYNIDLEDVETFITEDLPLIYIALFIILNGR